MLTRTAFSICQITKFVGLYNCPKTHSLAEIVLVKPKMVPFEFKLAFHLMQTF